MSRTRYIAASYPGGVHSTVSCKIAHLREDEFMTEILTLPVEPKSVVWNPTPEQLRRFTEEMPNCRRTEFGNVNVATKVVSRSKGSTFVATDTPEQHSDQTISRAEYSRMAKLQNDYI